MTTPYFLQSYFVGNFYRKINHCSYSIRSYKRGMSAMSNHVCPKFVNLDNYEDTIDGHGGFKFRLISYNILAQELDEYNSFYKSNMDSLGYSSLYVKRGGRKRDGCGIFYKPSCAELLEMEEIDYNDLVNCTSTLNVIGNSQELDGEVKDGRSKVLSQGNQSNDPHVRLKRDCVGLLAAFKLNDPSNHIIVLANSHIYWDPNWADVKLAQAKYLLSRLSQFKELVSNKFTCVPSVLVAGDFNSTPGDEVYNHLVSTSEEAPIRLCSLYATYGEREPEFTNFTPGFTGTLDYIFLSGPRLKPVSLLELPGHNSLDVVGGLPNHYHPSDHLPIGADFLVLNSS